MTEAAKTISLSQAKEFAKIAARAADEKKAIRPVVLDVGDILSITEAFVIASASNPRLVKTISEEIEEAVKKAGGPGPRRLEGTKDSNWILMDYGDWVVHVFLEETRDFYDLERLWQDASKLDWSDDQAAAVND